MTMSFFQQNTLTLARHLLGATLHHQTKDGLLQGKIVETEAYLGTKDRAAHSFNGKRTKRTEVMYGPPGYAYLYLIYGIHVCLNVVSGPREQPEAILIRALEPTSGIDVMLQHRPIQMKLHAQGDQKSTQLKPLTNGPAKLVKALDISLSQYGCDLSQSPLFISPPREPVPQKDVATGPRIGIENTGEARDYPYRFWIKNHPFVSK